ncbi:MAG: type II toxin-antitoxin system RelE/ParE family toxin [Proteobacteria bacterium]|nr:type II toxin-antitoxin system RelE/ParE family toxin [Pseudomonadota bacterium]
MRLEFHPQALAEFEQAALYYEEHQPGLGFRFYASVEAALQSIVEAPVQWPILNQDIRRCLTRIFPYAVLYTVEPEYVLVVAVMHCHRKPGYWLARIQPGTDIISSK